MEFKPFPKIARWSREVLVTEKLDGTNACVVIEDTTQLEYKQAQEAEAAWRGMTGETIGSAPLASIGTLNLYAQSRNRMLSLEDDNFGFAAWVRANAEVLAGFGAGRHFGEWWGSGIARRYNQTEKRFSLFNTIRWCAHDAEPKVIPTEDPAAEPKYQRRAPACVSLVPLIWQGPMDDLNVDLHIEQLRLGGSFAAPGFMRPEGIIVFHVAGNVGFKKTLERDEVPKGKTR